MNRARLLAIASFLLLPMAACQPGPSSLAQVDLFEFGIGVDHPVWAQGQVSLNVANTGEFPHTLVVTRQGGEVVAAGYPLAAGQTGTLVLDLDPGTYALTCRIVSQTPDGTIVDHYERGMSATIEVVAP